MPTSTWVAVLVPSRYTAKRVAVPLAAAVNWKASAMPAELLSRLPSIVAFPTSTTDVVVGVPIGIVVAGGVTVGVAVAASGGAVGIVVRLGVALPVGGVWVAVAAGVDVGSPLVLGVAV